MTKPTLGVILSDTTFRRPVGDVGNAASYDHPVIFHVAKGVTAEKMVRAVPNGDLLDAYLEGALALQENGASVITTTCGFLAALQDAIAPKLSVLFVASSVLLVPLLHRLTGGRVGILTANDDALTRAHLTAAGVSDSLPIAVAGLQHYKEFADPLLRGIGEINVEKVERCVVQAATDLARERPDIKAFLCECHNLPPFSKAIQSATGKPVFDILSVVALTFHGLVKPTFQ